jgi:serine/threonine-protein kinase ULK/ATG1
MLKTPNNFYFVYEYCNGGTREKLLRKTTLDEKQSLLYFKQLTNGFKLLAEHTIMHRDIKPDNILIHNGMLKIADFGFCKPLEHPDCTTNTMLGSPVYMAPEVLRGQPYTMKADVWSLGVVLYRMLFGVCPFESDSIAMLIQIANEL